MTIWPLILFIIVALIAMSSFYKRSNQERKKLAEIKALWGQVLAKARNFKLISAYLRIDTDSNISIETAADIDLDNVFEYIDRTSSKPGEQYLYKMLHQPQYGEGHFTQLEQEITKLTANKERREAIQLKLSKLNNGDAYYLPELFAKPHQSLFHPLVELYIKTAFLFVIALITLLVVATNQIWLFLLLGVLFINTGLHFQNKNKVIVYTRSLPQLLLLYSTGKWLFKEDLFTKDSPAGQSLTNIAKLKRSLNSINLQGLTASDPTDMSYLLMEWLNMFLLIEPRNFIASIKKVNNYRSDIRTLFECVARVDVAIGIQSVRDGLPYYCKPNFTTDGGELIIQDLFHPLIDDCIPNSISSNNSQGVLITGSNMSGKTTFIRAITINTLLSQTIHTSCARVYQAPPLKIFTSIDMSDDLGGHKSYFQAEALSVLNIVKNCPVSEPVKSLVIIDEIFRGTNTIDRIAAAKAVLSYLIANKNFVFVSTHDLELAELLGNEYAVYSFEEMAGDDRLVFDYKIKKGLLKNKNGIAVLQGLGYPQDIINDAYVVSRQLKEKYDL
ncbi:MutS domain V [Mucilaginibacter pineti]|uniref:MutS domain V n=1 Tax=Mucilaginibacter pineti TaxID=1391627 RepID=A0A1G7MT10_9SPHI|nr:hypothetical protein [Mucilaginibacter pineti]SDF64892.1 MutS domain V [Mucilaginibacter pineti]